MIYRLNDITTDIDSDQPFAKCKLGREMYASVLTSIVKDAEGGVIALNGAWGAGKTTFVKMWQAYLRKEGFKALYFNAWENDYNEDPMVDLMAQLYETVKNVKNPNVVRNLLGKFGKIVVSVGKPVVKSMVNKAIGGNADDILEGLNEAKNVAVDELASEAKKALDKLEENKEDIEKFRKLLEKLVKQEENDENEKDVFAHKPIIYIIDELDRCNPRYAVKVLERVKHLFCISGIVFVLAVDKKQLSNAICGYYGSDLIDANEYLRRFIDLDLTLPTPSMGTNFVDYLEEKFCFEDFFLHPERLSSANGEYERQCFTIMVKLLLNNSDYTLRQIEKYMCHARIIFSRFSPKEFSHPDIIISLLYLRFVAGEVYDNIRSHKYLVQNFVNELNKHFGPYLISTKDKFEIHSTLANCMAKLIIAYNLDENGGLKEELVDKEQKDKLRIDIGNIPQEYLIRQIKKLENDPIPICKKITRYIDEIEIVKMMNPS